MLRAATVGDTVLVCLAGEGMHGIWRPAVVTEVFTRPARHPGDVSAEECLVNCTVTLDGRNDSPERLNLSEGFERCPKAIGEFFARGWSRPFGEKAGCWNLPGWREGRLAEAAYEDGVHPLHQSSTIYSADLPPPADEPVGQAVVDGIMGLLPEGD